MAKTTYSAFPVIISKLCSICRMVLNAFNENTSWAQVVFQHRSTEHNGSGRKEGDIRAQQLFVAPGPPTRLIHQWLQPHLDESENIFAFWTI